MTGPAAPLTEQLVDVALASSRPTPPVRRAAARLLFDFWACAIDGARGLPSWPLDGAARLALAAHLHDQDDLHLGSGTHPGGVVWSVVAATAVERDATLGEAFAAATFGYELTVRMARAAGPAHLRRWHATATAGTVGAAGASALVLSPGCASAADAVGHAISVAGGSIEAVFELSGTRFFHRAHAASTGVACARAACSGLSASKLGLEAERGTFVDPGPDLLAARASTAVEETGVRLLAASGFSHAAADAAAALGPLRPDAIRRVEAVVSPPAAVALASNPAPADDEHAWWSIEHAVAVVLAAGDTEALTGRLSEHADVLDLCRRIEVVRGEPGWGAAVEVTLEDGSVRRGASDGPRGHPPADEDLLRKWQRLARSDGSRLLARLFSAEDDAPLASLLPRELADLLR